MNKQINEQMTPPIKETATTLGVIIHGYTSEVRGMAA